MFFSIKMSKGYLRKLNNFVLWHIISNFVVIF